MEKKCYVSSDIVGAIITMLGFEPYEKLELIKEGRIDQERGCHQGRPMSRQTNFAGNKHELYNIQGLSFIRGGCIKRLV